MIDEVQKNTVIKNKRYVTFVIADRVDDSEGMRLKMTGEKYIAEIREELQQKALVLIDINKAKYFSATSCRLWADFLRLKSIEKTAIFGSSKLFKAIVMVIISVSGMKNVQYFYDEQSAMGWLGRE